MTTDRDIMRLAREAIETYSVEAIAVVGMKADTCLESGDFAAQRLWLRVLAAVHEIRQCARPMARG